MAKKVFKDRQEQALHVFREVAPNVDMTVIEAAAANPELQMYVEDREYVGEVLQKMAVEHS